MDARWCIAANAGPAPQYDPARGRRAACRGPGRLAGVRAWVDNAAERGDAGTVRYGTTPGCAGALQRLLLAGNRAVAGVLAAPAVTGTPAVIQRDLPGSHQDHRGAV